MPSLNDQVRAAVDANNHDHARKLLVDGMQNANGETYYLASLVANDDNERLVHLKKALELDPFHQLAYRELKAIQAKPSLTIKNVNIASSSSPVSPAQPTSQVVIAHDAKSTVAPKIVSSEERILQLRQALELDPFNQTIHSELQALSAKTDTKSVSKSLASAAASPIVNVQSRLPPQEMPQQELKPKEESISKVTVSAGSPLPVPPPNRVTLPRDYIPPNKLNPFLFISYEMGATDAITGAIYQALANRFRPEFIRAAANRDQYVLVGTSHLIRKGDNYKHITAKLASSYVVVVVIGPNWLKNIVNTYDHVLIAKKVYWGLAIPVLVEGAKPPAMNELPENLRGLFATQPVRIEQLTLDRDLKTLVSTLEKFMRLKDLSDTVNKQTSARRRRNWLPLTILASALAGFLWYQKVSTISRQASSNGSVTPFIVATVLLGIITVFHFVASFHRPIAQKPWSQQKKALALAAGLTAISVAGTVASSMAEANRKAEEERKRQQALLTAQMAQQNAVAANQRQRQLQIQQQQELERQKALVQQQQWDEEQRAQQSISYSSAPTNFYSEPNASDRSGIAEVQRKNDDARDRGDSAHY